MILIGIALLVLGLLILPLAWRGRISARGQFCRKCRFDLAGSPIDTEGNKCPECGEQIHTQSTRRTTLRRSSRIGLVVAVILLLAGLSGIGFGITGNSAALFARMPDGIIVRLSTMGFDDALDDLVLRLTRTQPLSDAHWNQLISNALSHQADTTARWDLRWGEILFQGCIAGHMNDDQLRKYIVHGTNLEMDIRGRVPHGSNTAGYTLNVTSSKRIEALITGGDTGYELSLKIIEYGIVGQPASNSRIQGLTKAKIIVPGKAGMLNRSTYGITGSLWNLESLSEASVGDQVTIFVEIQFEIQSVQDDTVLVTHQLRIEQEVHILGADEPVVGQYKDQQATEDVRRGLIISPVYVVANSEAEDHPSLGSDLAFIITTKYVNAALGLRVLIRLDDQEIEVGDIIRDGVVHGEIGSSFHLRIQSNERYGIETARAIHAKAFSQGHLDIVLRTQSSVADRTPSIDRVLSFSGEFRSVPVKVVERIKSIENDSGVECISIP